MVSTHSRAEAAAIGIDIANPCDIVSTHSRAEAAAVNSRPFHTGIARFQHTAARRRLLMILGVMLTIGGFNTQPRGGGCEGKAVTAATVKPFQHTAARRRLRALKPCLNAL